MSTRPGTSRPPMCAGEGTRCRAARLEEVGVKEPIARPVTNPGTKERAASRAVGLIGIAVHGGLARNGRPC